MRPTAKVGVRFRAERPKKVMFNRRFCTGVGHPISRRSPQASDRGSGQRGSVSGGGGDGGGGGLSKWWATVGFRAAKPL